MNIHILRWERLRRFLSGVVPVALILVMAALVVACSEPAQAAGNDAPAPASTGSAARGGGSVLDRVLERGVLRVGTTGDFQPMTFINPDTDEYEGYYIDVVRALAADMGVEIEWVVTTWQDKVAGISAGRYDIATGASFNLGRARQGAFTHPIAGVGTVPLTTRENASRFTTWESLNDPTVRIAVTLGTTFDQQANDFFPEARIVRPDSGARDFQEVLSGRADAWITSNIEASDLIQRFPNVVIVPVEPRATVPNGMIVDRNDPSWLHYVNSWIVMREYAGYFNDLAAEYGLEF